MPSTVVYPGIIRKSETDKCSYRHIHLPNGLQALLVHEPNCHKAAAALDVHVGSFHDPENIPGLAHFLEHLLFMGTEKYPDENDYGKFLNEHGGSSNAFTASEHTNYFFDVNCDHLEGALDRFSQFFVAPLFLESSTEREMQAVDSEHSKNKLQDNWRLSQLEKSLANPEHPYHKFGTGDMKTLGEAPKGEGINIREVLIDFHKRWYSANIMSLTVLGKESLDDLQAMAERMFSEVENKNTDKPKWTGAPWTDEQRNTFIRVKSIKDLRTLYLTWLCPDTKGQFLVKPQKYFSHLIGHEGEGSILALLKKKGWAVALSAGCDDDSTGYSFFEVSIELSSLGLEHYREIVDLVFQYIELVNGKSDQPDLTRCLEECLRLSNIGFAYKDAEDPSNFSYRAARNLHRYPPEYALSGPYIQEQVDMGILREYGACLSRSNVRAILSTRDDPEYKGTWSRERWYGTEYYVTSLQEHVARCPTDELHLPTPNEFIPDGFDVVIKPAKPVPSKEPSNFLQDDKLRLWHKIDDTFETPKAVVRVLFRSDYVLGSVQQAVATHLFVEVVKELLTSVAYNAELAGISYEMSIMNEGIDLKLSGFADKLDRFLEVITKQMKSINPTEETFAMLKERYERQLANLEHEQPYWHCSYLVNGLLQQKTWWYWQRLEAIKNIKLDEVKQAGADLLAGCFIEALVHGSVEVPARFAEILRNASAGSNRPASLKALPIKQADGLVYRLPKDLADPNAAIEAYNQICQVSDTRSRALTGLFVQAFSEPFFDQLRTKEQLGYIVFCGRREKYDQIGVRFVIQSTKGDPKFLQDRINTFITGLPKMLAEMTAESFGDIKTALIAKLRQKKNRLSQEASAYWDQIVPSHYDWSRHEDDAKLLEDGIGKTDLEAFVKEHFLDSPRLLVAQAWPRQCEQPTMNCSKNGGPPLC